MLLLLYLHSSILQEITLYPKAGLLQLCVLSRPDSKNWQYQETIKKGDLLLNRVQKLSRVINM